MRRTETVRDVSCMRLFTFGGKGTGFRSEFLLYGVCLLYYTRGFAARVA